MPHAMRNTPVAMSLSGVLVLEALCKHKGHGRDHDDRGNERGERQQRRRLASHVAHHGAHVPAGVVGEENDRHGHADSQRHLGQEPVALALLPEPDEQAGAGEGVEEVDEAEPVVGDSCAKVGLAHEGHADVKVKHGPHADSHCAQGADAYGQDS